MVATLTEIITLAIFMALFLMIETAKGSPYHQETGIIKIIEAIPVSQDSMYYMPPQGGLISPDKINYLKEESDEKDNEEYETDRNQKADPQHQTVG